MLFKKLQLVFVFLFLVCISLGIATKAHAATYEEQVVSLINTERQKVNLSPLNTSDKLSQAAENHNTTMSDCAKVYGVNSCFLHQVTITGEKSLMDRVKLTGYNPQALAENIAWGYLTPKDVVTGWMNSSGHKANILGSYKDIGCDYLDSMSGSYKGLYWTCDFGKSFSTATTSSPTPTPTLRPTSQVSSPTPTQKPTATPTLTATPSITTTPSELIS